MPDSALRFSHLAEALPQMVWTAGADGQADYFNARWQEFTGASEQIRCWDAYLHPEDRDAAFGAWEAALKGGDPFSAEARLRGSEAYRWFLCRAVPVRDGDGAVARWFGSCTDISDIMEARETLARSREQLEALVAQRTAELAQANARLQAEIDQRIATEVQLRHAQKMEVVGQLTGGIAHDFNNLLTIILGNLEAAERRLLPQQGEVAGFLDHSRQGVLRAATLTRRLLAFSRRQPLDPRPVDMNRLVEGMCELLRRTLGPRVEVRMVLDPALWQAEVDAGQLESALLNLAVNARDAMPAGGRLTIETANVHLDEDYAQAHGEVVPGPYAAVCVSDNGEGMSADARSRAFDPFFTTKASGEGAGLGLSQVYGFVKQTGGHIKIYSEVGAGTSVKLYLPKVGGAREAQEEMPGAPGTRRPAVLVVDDEGAVRAHTAGLLEAQGYEVQEAAAAEAALDMLRGGAGVDLLLTDLFLGGGADGRDLADEARRLRPGLRVLYTTAFARHAIVHNGALDAQAPVLTKPFTPLELAGKVRHVLEQPEPRGTALLVEDEPFVAMVARQILEDEGFDVAVASTAGGALSYMERDGAGLVMAVVDLGLPDMPGNELVERLVSRRADLPIMIASGYGRAELQSLFGEHERLALLPKPYDVSALRRALRELGFAAED
ncbi:hybrid sensor histidine kinase/response regulator [Azorhizobium doebereinerae]|uniref:hybrid sensor histidine kinase/response regulator n=1 Tax=Azorhizobium doebereinerae TaxID=281091 RepID=UPI0003F93F23|nr:response regulator [Azorhizobium doebereinerae]